MKLLGSWPFAEVGAPESNPSHRLGQPESKSDGKRTYPGNSWPCLAFNGRVITVNTDGFKGAIITNPGIHSRRIGRYRRKKERPPGEDAL